MNEDPRMTAARLVAAVALLHVAGNLHPEPGPGRDRKPRGRRLHAPTISRDEREKRKAKKRTAQASKKRNRK